MSIISEPILILDLWIAGGLSHLRIVADVTKKNQMLDEVNIGEECHMQDKTDSMEFKKGNFYGLW